MRRLFVILVVVFGISSLNAQQFTHGYLNYSINDDGISVTVTGHVNGNEATGSIAIPNAVPYNGNSYIVTKIGVCAFTHSHDLHGTLTIGNNVRDIGYGAFAFCDHLTGNLIIPNSVTTIGSNAFQNCDGFTGSLIIPNSVTSIHVYAFEQCDGFNGTLVIGSSVDTIGACAFQLCRNFQRAVCLATEPPLLGVANNTVSVFYGFGCSTITVPCGSKTAYDHSTWHSSSGSGGSVVSYGFNTIIEYCESLDNLVEPRASVYPNPAKDFIQIAQSDNSYCQSIEIYSIDGCLVETFPETSQQTTIDIANLTAGIYIMKVRLSDGREYAERIVKE